MPIRYNFFIQAKSVLIPENACSTILKITTGCCQMTFRMQFISCSIFLWTTFEEIVNLYGQLFTLPLKTVQRRGTFEKELVQIGCILF